MGQGLVGGCAQRDDFRVNTSFGGGMNPPLRQASNWARLEAEFQPTRHVVAHLLTELTQPEF